jgi:hypothetical protein
MALRATKIHENPADGEQAANRRRGFSTLRRTVSPPKIVAARKDLYG